jgi:branched-chain amino acid transport system permease protein
MAFPVYRLFVIGVTAAVLVALWLFLEKTNVGLVIRAGSRDAVMVRALRIDLGRIWFLVFGIGAALAGLAGPMRGVYADMGVTIVIESFVVVVVGGMGSLPGLGGAVIGFLCLRRRGIYLAMLTLAFAQLLYFIGFHAADLTGGDDGLRGIPLLPLALPGVAIPLTGSLPFYYFAFALVSLAVAGLKRILDSPFGAVLQAIRENPGRAAACGYDIDRVKWLSFVFSALFTGLAGALEALRLNVVPVESLYWTTSGQVVMMTLLGGAGTFFGPFVGALAFLVLEDRLSVVTEAWPMLVGAIFVVFVLFLPRGIWGSLTGGLHGRHSA